MGRRLIGEQPMTATERSRRRRERLQREFADAEVTRIAREAAGRERRRLLWEMNQGLAAESQVALIDFRVSTPKQIADVIVARARADKARLIADALPRSIAEYEAPGVVTKRDETAPDAPEVTAAAPPP